MAIEVGHVYPGEIKGLTKFGAFVSLPEGKNGMVHISEISESYVKDIKDHVKEGQKVKVKVISIDEKGRINLSMKRVVEEFTVTEKKPASFEDMLSKFKQESDDKFADLKQQKENRRGEYQQKRRK